jgi:hypothetical protein
MSVQRLAASPANDSAQGEGDDDRVVGVARNGHEVGDDVHG